MKKRGIIILGIFFCLFILFFISIKPSLKLCKLDVVNSFIVHDDDIPVTRTKNNNPTDPEILSKSRLQVEVFDQKGKKVFGI